MSARARRMWRADKSESGTSFEVPPGVALGSVEV